MQDAPHALCFETGPDCLQAMKIPLLRGRFFTPADTSESEPVVVIDSVLAQTYFAGKDRLGQIITVAHCARDRRRGPCAALAGLGGASGSSSKTACLTASKMLCCFPVIIPPF